MFNFCVLAILYHIRSYDLHISSKKRKLHYLAISYFTAIYLPTFQQFTFFFKRKNLSLNFNAEKNNFVTIIGANEAEFKKS